jgi:hypothetical protein
MPFKNIYVTSVNLRTVKLREWGGEREREETEGMRGQNDTTFIMTGGGDKKFTTLKAPRQYPLVLLVKIGWKEGRAMGSEERSALGIGTLGV